jgi:hypothetical protein
MASSTEMIRDLTWQSSSPRAESTTASLDIRNLWGSAFPWYLGVGVARYCVGQGANCRWWANGLLGFVVLSCASGSEGGGKY